MVRKADDTPFVHFWEIAREPTHPNTPPPHPTPPTTAAEQNSVSSIYHLARSIEHRLAELVGRLIEARTAERGKGAWQ